MSTLTTCRVWKNRTVHIFREILFSLRIHSFIPIIFVPRRVPIKHFHLEYIKGIVLISYNNALQKVLFR